MASLRDRLGDYAQSMAFYAALIAIAVALGWLSVRYHAQADWTRSSRHTLSEISQRIVAELNDPVELTAYLTPKGSARTILSDLVARYQRANPLIELRYVDPEQALEEIEKLGLSTKGELVISYRGREERLRKVTEQTLSSALLRLARDNERWIVFLGGHGERDPLSGEDDALGEFGQKLLQAGLRLHQHNLATLPGLPDNTAVLVLAGARSDFFPGETAIVVDYLRRGGNLLWLLESGNMAGLQRLAAELGLKVLPGRIVDSGAEQLKLSGRDHVLIGDFSATHPVTHELATLALLRSATALTADNRQWDIVEILRSSTYSWTERDTGSADLRFDEGTREQRGPLTVGIAMSRRIDVQHQQRVAVIGDADFLSNSLLGTGGNLELGLKLVNWLSGDDALVDLHRRRPPDIGLNMTGPVLVGYALVFLAVVPLGFIATGYFIWWRRKRRR